MQNAIHASVIAKYANFPRLALAASILLNGDSSGEDINHEDSNHDSRMLMPLSKEDYRGYLPLHWACGDTSFLPYTYTSKGVSEHMSATSQRRGQAYTFSNDVLNECNEANVIVLSTPAHHNANHYYARIRRTFHAP